jgi:CHAT domain-containing protein/tetratricopeptide (TPR) repeat protein
LQRRDAWGSSADHPDDERGWYAQRGKHRKESEKLLDKAVDREDFKAARALRSELLDTKTRQRGKDHWEVTDARLALDDVDRLAALTPARRARLKEAERLGREAVELVNQGKPSEAITLVNQKLAIYQETFGEKHRKTAACIADLATLHESAQKNQQAEAFYLRGVELRKAILGERHPETLNLQNDLGVFSYNTGRYDRAVVASREAANGRRAIFGVDHESTVLSEQNLATALEGLALSSGNAEKYAPAVSLLREAVALRTKLGEARMVKVDRSNELRFQVKALRAQGKPREALGISREAADLLKEIFGAQSSEYATGLNDLAGVCSELGQLATALDLLKQSLDIQRQTIGEDQPAYALAVGNLGYQYLAMGDHVHAEPLLNQAAELRRKHAGEASAEYALCLNNLGELHRAKGDFNRAESELQHAIAIWRKTLGDDDPSCATARSNLALVYQARGEYDQSAALIDQALRATEKTQGKGHPDYALKLLTRATLLQQKGDYPAALDDYRRVLDIQKKTLGETSLAYAHTQANLSGLRAAMNDPAEARLLGEQALATFGTILGRNHPSYALQLHNFAHLCYKLGDLARSEQLMRESQAIVEKTLGREHLHYAYALNGLAAIAMLRHDPARAQKLLEEAVDLSRRLLGENHPDYAKVLGNLGYACLINRDLDRAESVLANAAAIVKARWTDAHPDYARYLDYLGEVSKTRGDYGQAEARFQEALKTGKSLPANSSPEDPAVLRNLAIVYQATGRLEQALATMERSLTIEQARFRDVLGFSSESQMQALLDVYGGSTRVLVAMAAEPKAAPGAVTLAFHWVLRRKALVFDALHRVREAQRAAATDPAFGRELARYRTLRQQLSNLALVATSGSAEALQARTRSLRSELDEVEAGIHRTLASRARSAGVDDAEANGEAVRRRLPSSAALVEIVRSEGYDFRARGTDSHWKPARYFAFVLTPVPQGPPQLFDLGDAEEMDRQVTALRDCFQRHGKALASRGGRPLDRPRATVTDLEAEYRTQAAALHARVVGPLRQTLEGANVIFLAPDGELNRVPFEALVDPTGKYLVETCAFAYLSSGRDLLRQTAAPGRGTVLFADPDYNLDLAGRRAEVARLAASGLVPAAPASRGPSVEASRGQVWERLPGAAAEATDVQRLLGGGGGVYGPVRSYLGPAALEEAFKAVRGPKVIHVATHGFFLPDQRSTREELPDVDAPGTNLGSGAAWGLVRLQHAENPLLRSGLVFSGANTLGRAPADPAVDDGWMTADEIALMDLQGTDLVVLSACSTGLGDVRVGEGVQGLRRSFLHAGARTLVTSLFAVPDEPTRVLMTQFYTGLKAGQTKLAALHAAQTETIARHRKSSTAAHPFYWAGFVLVGSPD